MAWMTRTAIWPSYVEGGPMLFIYGYGPFVGSTSAVNMKTIATDRAAMERSVNKIATKDRDNFRNWIRDAEKNQLVVGTQLVFSIKIAWAVSILH